jgi:C1A family cysteine protease
MVNWNVVGVLFLVLISLGVVEGMRNPAAVYCEELGERFGDYSYEVVEVDGGQQGVCVLPDGANVSSWDFYSGKEGEEFSYCSKMGWATIRGEGVNGPAVCVKRSRSRSVMSVDSISSASIESVDVAEAMELDLEDLSKELQEDEGAEPSLGEFVGGPVQSGDIPSEWDWRNPSSGEYVLGNYLSYDDTNGWLTDVKNQGALGTCWAFASLGSVESILNIENNNSLLNPDLSEAYIASKCGVTSLGRIASPAVDFGTYYPIWAFHFLQGDYSFPALFPGVVDEQCFPYSTSSDYYSAECSTIVSNCQNASERAWTAPSLTTIAAFNHNSDPDNLRDYVYRYGPATVTVTQFPGTYSLDAGDFVKCASGGGHEVVVVGYNNTGEYWIIKNSWGTGWGDSGYAKLDYDCYNTRITKVLLGNDVVQPSYSKPLISFDYSNYSNDNVLYFNFTVDTRFDGNWTCDLLVNDIQNQTTGKIVGINYSNFTVNLSSVLDNVSLMCWEEDMGAYSLDTDLLRTVVSDVPSVEIISPLNGYENDTARFVQVNYSVSGSYLDSCWFYNWSSRENETIDDCNNFSVNLLWNDNYTLKVYANNSFGNVGVNDSINFLINYSVLDLDGLGDESDPYLIETCEDLQNMSSELYSYFALNNSVNCSNSSNWNSLAGFEPVGDNSSRFQGGLDGLGYNISGLFINRSDENETGMFGVLGEFGFVKNLTLLNVYVRGNYDVGSIAGLSYGEINDTHTIGSVVGASDLDVDNLVGALYGSSLSSSHCVYSSGGVCYDFEISVSSIDDSASISRDVSYSLTSPFDVVNCSLYLDGDLSSSNSSVVNFNSDSNSLSVSGLSVASHSVVVSCMDVVGNVANGSASFSVTQEAVQQTSSGGGGGGGSSVETISSDAVELRVYSGKKVEFKQAGVKHSLGVNEIDSVNKKVNITIQSEPQNFFLGENESVLVNLDGDGSFDLNLTVLEIFSNKIRFSLVEVNIPTISGEELFDGDVVRAGIVNDSGEGGFFENVEFDWGGKLNELGDWVVGVVSFQLVLFFKVGLYVVGFLSELSFVGWLKLLFGVLVVLVILTSLIIKYKISLKKVFYSHLCNSKNCLMKNEVDKAREHLDKARDIYEKKKLNLKDFEEVMKKLENKLK